MPVNAVFFHKIPIDLNSSFFSLFSTPLRRYFTTHCVHEPFSVYFPPHCGYTHVLPHRSSITALFRISIILFGLGEEKPSTITTPRGRATNIKMDSRRRKSGKSNTTSIYRQVSIPSSFHYFTNIKHQSPTIL